MNDQAQALRNLVKTRQKPKPKTTRIITVTSGKGGVGKSNFTLNFALSLQKMGYNVLIFDADIGMANIDVLMGISPRYNLYHLLKREKTIWEIINKGHFELQFIAGGSGFSELIRLKEEELEYFSQQVNELNGYVDYIIFDTGAGLSKESLKFIVAAHETIVVTTPEPTAITDAYATIKMVHAMDYDVSFQLVINRVTNLKEGKQTAEKICLVAKQFLDIDIPTLGYVADDMNVTKAVKKQTPLIIAYPHSIAAKGIEDLAKRYVSNHKTTGNPSGGIKGFITKMLRMTK